MRRYAFIKAGLPVMMSRISALRSSAALLKLKLPVMTVLPSSRMTLLWAMACLESMKTGMPWWRKNVAEL